MRSAVVPAQVTTVEFKVAGNLGVAQFCLLAFAIFCSGLIYALLPPLTHGTTPKIILITAVCAICGLLALRIKDRIILSWLGVYCRYYFRPKDYVFNKRSDFARHKVANEALVQDVVASLKPSKTRSAITLTTAEIARIEDLLGNPAAKLKFENKKGKLHVRITDIRV